MAKIGDRVRFLNSVGGGIIKRIEGNIAYVDDAVLETHISRNNYTPDLAQEGGKTRD